MAKLIRCQACSHHILSDQSMCPFCEKPAQGRSEVRRNLVKSAALAGALAAASTGMVGCGESSTPTDSGTATDVGGMDAGTDTATDTAVSDNGAGDNGVADTGPTDTGTDNVVQPPYGIPPDE